jgi:predicted 3-demethylubiquinone-9 3-methyltransferase (glyoxalase superfamily)
MTIGGARRIVLIRHTNMKPKNTICLWFDKDADEAARFHAATFPDSAVTAVHKAPGDYPRGKESDVLTVEFTVLGIPCLGLSSRQCFGLGSHRRDECGPSG